MSQITHIGLSFFGYSRGQVERLIEQKDQQIHTLEENIKRLEKEVATLQQDMAKYIDMEQALKDGIVDARRTGNQIVQESTEEAQRLVEKTNQQVVQYKEEFAAYSQDLVSNGSQLKDQLKTMKTDMLALLAQYQTLLEETDFDALYPEKEVTRFNLQLKEYVADEGFTLKDKEDLANFFHDGNLTDEEKLELKKLIHEVIAVEEGHELDPKETSSTPDSLEDQEEDTASSQVQSVKKVVGSDQVHEEERPSDESSSKAVDRDGKLVHFKPKHKKKRT